MKRTYQDNRQEIWIYKRRRYSIIDLRVVPTQGADDLTMELKEAFEEVMNKELPKPYEVADITHGIRPLGRFQSGEQAVEFMRDYTDQKIYKLTKDN